jgi:hypothetical protein
VAELEPAAEAVLVEEFQQFMARNKTVVRVGQRLHPTHTAVSVRRAPDGGVRITDGAFTESKGSSPATSWSRPTTVTRPSTSPGRSRCATAASRSARSA